MATINQNWFRFLGWNTQGDLGPLTMYTDKRRSLVWFVKMPPLNPPSVRQTIQRNKFALVHEAWCSLPPQQRADWETATKRARLRITGRNLYTYWQLTKDNAAIRTIENQTGLSLLPT